MNAEEAKAFLKDSLINPLFDYVKQQMECENMLVRFGIDILSTTYFLYRSTDTWLI